MTTTVEAQAESAVREFAAQFPTPNVLEGLRLCETGVLPWEPVAQLFRDSLADALDEVKA